MSDDGVFGPAAAQGGWLASLQFTIAWQYGEVGERRNSHGTILHDRYL